MSLEPLSIENLDQGRALEKINEALARVVRDVSERSDIEVARKVTLTIGIKPQTHEAAGHMLLCPEIIYVVNHAVPPSVGNRVIGEVKLDSSGKETLLIDVDIPGNPPNQRTIFDERATAAVEVDPETGEVR